MRDDNATERDAKRVVSFTIVFMTVQQRPEFLHVRECEPNIEAEEIATRCYLSRMAQSNEPKVKAAALTLDLYRVHNKIYDGYIPFVIEKEFIRNVFIIQSDNYSILK